MSIICIFSCTKPILPDLNTIETRVKSVLSLHTYEMLYKDISWVSENEKLFNLFTTIDKRLLFSVRIRVRAGIDTKKGFQIELINHNTTSAKPHPVYVHLAPAEILLVDVDETTINQYFSLEFGAKFKRSDWEQPLTEARKRVHADAISRGILDRADLNAQRLIKNILELSGLEIIGFKRNGLLIPTHDNKESEERAL